MASFSPFASKPKVSCPLAQQKIDDEPEVVVIHQRKAPVKPESVIEPEPWRLTVLVKCVDRQSRDTQLVPEKTVQVSLTPKEGSAAGPLAIEKDDFAGGIGQTKVSKRRKFDVAATGHTVFEVSAAVEKWKMVAAKTIVLDDGEKKDVTIDIRPLAWVQFEVVDVDKKPIPGVTLNLVLPARDKYAEDTKDTDPIRIVDLEDGKAKVEAATHGTDVWEVVDVSSK